VFAHIHKCIVISVLNASNSAFNDTQDAAWQARIGAVVDDRRIEIANDQLVLFGSVASYYLKQMVQVVAAEVFPGSRLVNLIAVTC